MTQHKSKLTHCKQLKNINIFNVKNNDRKFIFLLFQCSAGLIISYHGSKNKSFKVVMLDRLAPYQEQHQTSTTHGTVHDMQDHISILVVYLILSLWIKLTADIWLVQKRCHSCIVWFKKGAPEQNLPVQYYRHDILSLFPFFLYQLFLHTLPSLSFLLLPCHTLCLTLASLANSCYKSFWYKD